MALGGLHRGEACLRLMMLALSVLASGVCQTEAHAQGATTKTLASTAELQSVFGLFRSERQVASGQAHFKDATFAGSESCKSCHAEQYAEWKTTWHSKMEQWATPETVLGNFDNHVITYRDIEVRDKAGQASKVTFQVKTHKDDKGYYFTVFDDDNPANNQTFKIAKTLGGKWDQGYEIQIGKNFYPALLRYSVKQNGWLVSTFMPELWVEPDGTPDGRPRQVSELPMIRTAEAKCAGCHTSGYTFEKDPSSGVWNAHGDGELGVGCEKCHGPASLHVKAAVAAKVAGRKIEASELKIVHGLKDLDNNQQTQMCAQCHGRSTNRKQTDLSFPQGFLPGDTDIMEHLVFWSYQGNGNPAQNSYVYRNDWAKRNRQQWQDFSKSKHFNKAGLSCLTCHTFHGKWEDMQLRQSPAQLCESCHTADGVALRPQTEMFRGSNMQQAGVRCIDCHMARIGFRSHLVEGTRERKHFPMDGSSHVFQAATPQLKKQFGVRTACEACHSGGRAPPQHIESWVMPRVMSNDEQHAQLTGIQAKVRALMGDVMAALASTPKNLSARNEANVEKARTNIGIVKLDGSMGFHNPKRAEELLLESLQLLRAAGSTVAQARLDASPPKAVAGFVASAAISPRPAAASAAAPAANALATSASAEPLPGNWYLSREGDNLWNLAKRLYGSGAQFERVYEANTDRMTSPSYLRPGTRLWLPK